MFSSELSRASDLAAAKTTAIISLRMDRICGDLAYVTSPQVEAIHRIVKNYGTYGIGEHKTAGFWEMCRAAVSEPHKYGYSIVGRVCDMRGDDVKLATGWTNHEMQEVIDRFRTIFLKRADNVPRDHQESAA